MKTFFDCVESLGITVVTTDMKTIWDDQQKEIDHLKKQKEILRECVESLGWHANAKDTLTKLEAMEKEG
ncbi:MAG: hypothetical protein CME63_01465 [Halobacteriovoraceae bacterium]|nr:hypothetical protein [Halobacteriovoraceae bacterium]|tara:strand:+ start:23319 stop:23525 length:207 start_codon:yes stop_codon:yes gene_type:complete